MAHTYTDMDDITNQSGSSVTLETQSITYSRGEGDTLTISVASSTHHQVASISDSGLEGMLHMVETSFFNNFLDLN